MRRLYLVFVFAVLVFVMVSCGGVQSYIPPRNFSDLQELEEFLAQDLTEDEDYDDFLPYALKLQSNALSKGYLVNINYVVVDLGEGGSYTLVVNSAIAGNVLYSIVPCNLFMEVDPSLPADTVREILVIPEGYQ